MVLRWLVASSCLLAVGCPKAPSADRSDAAAPPASVAPAPTAPVASASVAPAPTAPVASASVAPGPTAPVAPASVASALACGKSPLPDCPLQGWMKEHSRAAVLHKDFPALVAAFDSIATFAPAGYGNWVSIAKDGANAARAMDDNAVKAACRSCHDQYKTKYRAELRARPIP